MTFAARTVIADGAGAANFTPVTHTYAPGSGTETIPVGASLLVIEAAGSGGSAGGATGSGQTLIEGGGGGSGGLCRYQIALTSANWGQTFTWSLGAGGPTTSLGVAGTTGGAAQVFNGTFGAAVSITAGGGQGGPQGGSGPTANGGSAAGGNVANTNGNGTSLVTGGAAITGLYVSSGKGGDGSFGLGGAGNNGGIAFAYT